MNLELLCVTLACAFLCALCCAVLEHRKRKEIQKILEDSIKELADISILCEKLENHSRQLEQFLSAFDIVHPEPEEMPRSKKVKELLDKQDNELNRRTNP